MKRKVSFLIAMIIVICLFLVTASAGTWGEWTQKYKDELDASKNSNLVAFTPTVLTTIDANDFFSSSSGRAGLTFLMGLEVSNDGHPEVCHGLLDYASFIGKASDTYIVVGMCDNHTFELYYSPKERSGAYRITTTVLSENEIKSFQESNLSSVCSESYANSKWEIQSFYDIITSSSN